MAVYSAKPLTWNLLSTYRTQIAILFFDKSYAGQIGAGIGYAHADAKEGFGGADFRQVELALRLRAELEDQGPAVAVGDPVRVHRGAGGQQFFHQHEAKEGATVLRRQGHADPARAASFLLKAALALKPIQERARTPAGIGSRLDLRKAFTSARNGFVPAGSVASRKADSRLFKKFSSVGFIHR
jgi:hypothetical protein